VAIRNYEIALKYDRELTNGNSFFASEIKSELADLMVLLGQSQKQKRALTQGPPTAAKKTVRPKKRSRSASIDDAFDEDEGAGFDEEEPAPKPKKKAPSRSAIDDAFEE
jgi:hypothetical protein